MKNFMDGNFLLQTETSQKLYHEHAAKMPIIDYHCHLIPQMVAEDYQFKSLTEIWLGGDHYKWRAMRTNGVDERFCTGKDTTDWEKFEKWAETVPYTFRNPLYHWTHLELKTAFGIDKILNPHTAREIYDECNEKYSPFGEVVSICPDPSILILPFQAWTHFVNVFNWMPIAALVNRRVLCMHGGLSPHIDTLEAIHNVLSL